MLAKKVAYNTLVQIIGKIVGFFISGITLVLIAEHLGTSNLGIYVTIVAFVGFFSTLADLGVNLILVRDIAQNEAERVRITGEFFGFRLTFSLIIMALAPLVAALIPQYGELIVKGVVIAVITQFLLLINQLFISLLQTQLLLDRGVLAELVNRLVTLTLIVTVIHRGLTGDDFFYAILYISLIGAVVNTAITYLFARRLWPITLHLNPATWKRTLLVVAPIGAFTFLGMVHFKADTIILSLLKPPHDVGVYGYAYKIGEILFTFPTMFMGAVFPRLSQLLHSDRAKFNQFAQTSFDVLLIGTIPFLSFVFIMAKYFTLLLSRGSYSDGIQAGYSLEILTVAMMAWFIGTFFIHLLIIANGYRGLIRNLSLAVVVNIGLNLYFIPRYSYLGAATTTVLTEALMLGLTVAYTNNFIQFSPKLRYLLPTLISTAVMVAAIQLTLHLPLANDLVFAQASRICQMAIISLVGLVGLASFLIPFWPTTGRHLLNHWRAEA